MAMVGISIVTKLYIVGLGDALYMCLIEYYQKKKNNRSLCIIPPVHCTICIIDLVMLLVSYYLGGVFYLLQGHLLLYHLILGGDLIFMHTHIYSDVNPYNRSVSM